MRPELVGSRDIESWVAREFGLFSKKTAAKMVRIIWRGFRSGFEICIHPTGERGRAASLGRFSREKGMGEGDEKGRGREGRENREKMEERLAKAGGMAGEHYV